MYGVNRECHLLDWQNWLFKILNHYLTSFLILNVKLPRLHCKQWCSSGSSSDRDHRCTTMAMFKLAHGLPERVVKNWKISLSFITLLLFHSQTTKVRRLTTQDFLCVSFLKKKWTRFAMSIEINFVELRKRANVSSVSFFRFGEGLSATHLSGKLGQLMLCGKGEVSAWLENCSPQSAK